MFLKFWITYLLHLYMYFANQNTLVIFPLPVSSKNKFLYLCRQFILLHFTCHFGVQFYIMGLHTCKLYACWIMQPVYVADFAVIFFKLRTNSLFSHFLRLFLVKFQMAVGMSGQSYVSDSRDNMRVYVYIYWFFIFYVFVRLYKISHEIISYKHF